MGIDDGVAGVATHPHPPPAFNAYFPISSEPMCAVQHFNHVGPRGEGNAQNGETFLFFRHVARRSQQPFMSSCPSTGNADFGEKRYHRAECSYTEAISLLDVMATVRHLTLRMPERFTKILPFGPAFGSHCSSFPAHAFLLRLSGLPSRNSAEAHRAGRDRARGGLPFEPSAVLSEVRDARRGGR